LRDGFSFPASDFGITVEQPIRSFELQLGSAYSATHKPGGGPGPDTSFRTTGTLIYWRRWWGPCFTEESASLRTPDFNKRDNYMTPCVVLRGYPFGIPSRLYFGYLLPSGKWDGADRSGIEASRDQGVTFYWEERLLNLKQATVRYRATFGLYRALEQGNPLCDGTEGVFIASCARIPVFEFNGMLEFALEFPRSNADATW
jgi:hypothetical protein